jgi:hypothetical protein
MQLTPAQTLSVNTTRTDGLQTETSTLLILTYVSRSPVACDLICRCLFTEMMLTVTGGGHIYPHSISERAGLVGVIVASSSQFVIVLSTSLIPANPIPSRTPQGNTVQAHIKNSQRRPMCQLSSFNRIFFVQRSSYNKCVSVESTDNQSP